MHLTACAWRHPTAAAPAPLVAADSEDYSSEDERQQAQRRCQKQRQKDRKAWGKGKLKGRKSDVGAGESGKLVAPAAGLGGQGEEEWSQWASAELEQQLLDEVHTTGEGWIFLLCSCNASGPGLPKPLPAGPRHAG
jgi:hypothetical protein